jgi:hypothetical protein
MSRTKLKRCFPQRPREALALGENAFLSNPLGTRSDANEGPGDIFNRCWSAEWDLAAKALADRWVFEMHIPLSAI